MPTPEAAMVRQLLDELVDAWNRAVSAYGRPWDITVLLCSPLATEAHIVGGRKVPSAACC
jgi:hypothetical protein